MTDPKQPLTNQKPAGPMFEDRVLVGFVAAVTLAMVWISWPFFGAILWALVVAIAFMPVHAWIVRRMPGWRNSAALLSLLLVIALVIVPAFVTGTLMVDEAISTYNSLQSREIDIGKLVRDFQAAIPPEWRSYLNKYGGNTATLQAKLSSVLTGGLQVIAQQAVTIGQRAFNFAMALGVMLYLTFFLLRDGRHISRRIGEVVPLRAEQRSDLFEKFTTVIRATVKGSIIVAIVQGILGGVAFALLDIRASLLWGVVMGLFALIPAVGTGLVWVPVSLYLLVTGSIWQGITLLLIGVFVISMVDNVLRPILVGQDTRMPDYVVLISTLGGLGVMGINGIIVGPVIASMFIATWEIFGASRAAQRH